MGSARPFAPLFWAGIYVGICRTQYRHKPLPPRVSAAPKNSALLLLSMQRREVRRRSSLDGRAPSSSISKTLKKTIGRGAHMPLGATFEAIAHDSTPLTSPLAFWTKIGPQMTKIGPYKAKNGPKRSPRTTPNNPEVLAKSGVWGTPRLAVPLRPGGEDIWGEFTKSTIIRCVAVLH